MRPGIVLVLLLAARPLAAQTSLTLSEAAAAALRVHPSQEAAAAAVARAASAEREARAAYLPSLQLDGSAVRFEEPMVVAPLHGFDPAAPPHFDRTLYQGALALGYTLFDGGARRARVGRASALGEAAEAAAEQARSALVAQVSTAYLRLVSARELAASERSRWSAVAAERARAAALFESGRAPRLALLRADAALGSAAADTVQSAARVEVAERSLARLLAVDVAVVRTATLSAVASRAPDPLAEADVVARALVRNPAVLRARAQLAAAELAAGEARAQWLPRLQLASRYGEYASGQGREAGEWQAGVQLGYSLFSGGARRAATERADAEVRLALAELRTAELQVADAVDAALSGWRAAQARATAVAAALRQAEEVVRVERLALDAGAGVQTDYLDAEAERFRVEAALTEARFAAALARVELARLTGELDIGWLRTNLESEP